MFNDDPDRNTPLHIALKKGNWVIISLLMENIKPGTKFNVRNAKGLFPYQCSNNPAIKDLFYRTYIANSLVESKDSIGINSLSHKLQLGCDQYRKKMLEEFEKAQKRCEKEKNQIMQSPSFQERLCICKGCQGCQSKKCQRIAKFVCKNCLCFLYCDKCIEFCKCLTCTDKEKNFFKVQQIPFNYTYPDFDQFIHNQNSDEKQDNDQ